MGNLQWCIGQGTLQPLLNRMDRQYNPEMKTIFDTNYSNYTAIHAMIICDKYNLKTVRGFALAFDIATQNGSISPSASSTIDAAIVKTPNMPEKSLLGIIATDEAASYSLPSKAADVLSRENVIVNGNGVVHGVTLNLEDAKYLLSDANWR